VTEIDCGTDKSGKHTLAIGEDVTPFRILIDGKPFGPPMGSMGRARCVADWVAGLDDVGALLGESKAKLPEKDHVVSWKDRLVIDPEVSETTPIVRGTWVTVGCVVALLEDGWSWGDILARRPELTEDDIRACLAYTMESPDA
jgi:uncharacterized protein (DUF433 family)